MKKRIVCFGDSNTWGFNAVNGTRFADHIRWPCLLAKRLGQDYQVIEEGLPGRTSVMDDPLLEGLNGFTYIHPCLMSHAPVELVIMMLGTNDTKERFQLTSSNIAQGICRVAKKIRQTYAGEKGNPPKLLVVAPPAIGEKYKETDVFHTMGKNCDVKSRELPQFLELFLIAEHIPFLNTVGKIEMNEIDYMHLDEKGHQKMAVEIYNEIKEML